jgi:hypothetical protein
MPNEKSRKGSERYKGSKGRKWPISAILADILYTFLLIAYSP